MSKMITAFKPFCRMSKDFTTQSRTLFENQLPNIRVKDANDPPNSIFFYGNNPINYLIIAHLRWSPKMHQRSPIIPIRRVAYAKLRIRIYFSQRSLSKKGLNATAQNKHNPLGLILVNMMMNRTETHGSHHVVRAVHHHVRKALSTSGVKERRWL